MPSWKSRKLQFSNDQLVRKEPNIGESSSNNLAAGDFIGENCDITVSRNAGGNAYAASNSVNSSIIVIGNSGSSTRVVTVQWNGIQDLDFTDGGALSLYVAFANPIDHARNRLASLVAK